MHLGSRTRIDLDRVLDFNRGGCGNVVSAWISAFALIANLIWPQMVRASVRAPQETILGLEGAEGIPTSRLTKSLRDDLKRRGLDAGTELTLLELRLTMGCSENDVGCIARGGRTINAQSLIYGNLKQVNSDYVLSLSRLDVKSEKIIARREYMIPSSALQGEKIKSTSTSIVDEVLGGADGHRRIILDDQGQLKRAQLLGTSSASTAAQAGGAGNSSSSGSKESSAAFRTNQHLIEPTVSDAESSDSATSEMDARAYQVKNSKHRVEAWPIVGFGVSAGVGMLALGTGVGATLMVRKGGPLLKDLVRTAEISLEDDDLDPNNNVDSRTSSNLCDAARAPRSSDPSMVTNSAMADICSSAESLQKVQIATFAIAGAMAVSSAIFSYFWIKKNRQSSNRKFAGKDTIRNAINDQKVLIGVSPTRGGLHGQLRLQF